MQDQGWVRAATQGGEEVDLIALALDALAEGGHTAQREDAKIILPDIGLEIAPRGWGITPINNGLRTVTTIKAFNSRFFPNGLFEYQHGAGDTLPESLGYGLRQWLTIDFPVLADLATGELKSCTAMDMEFPETETSPARRRILFGPPVRLALKPLSDDLTQNAESCECHDFCPCCLTTNSFEAFKPLFESSETYGVRLYAARDENGETMADCRVNGEDFPAGVAALKSYAAKWPDRGFEYRKQYVIYHAP